MALQNVGLLLFTVERYEEGLGYFLRALALDPSLLERSSTSGLPIVAQSTPANTAMFSYYMAKVSATAGNRDLTMSYLYRAVEEGLTDMALIGDEAFGLLAADERYTALLASLETP
jgi:tetratricopeptide (TPR) repeat protein